MDEINRANERRSGLIDRTKEIYLFLLLSLAQQQYRFSNFDLEDEVTVFFLYFSEKSSIRKLSCEDPSASIGRLMIKVFQTSDGYLYRIVLEAENGGAIYCSSLGYKDSFREFTSEVQVLEESLRLEKATIKYTVVSFSKTYGECSVCYNEGETLMWPCHRSHIVCADCTSKIIDSQSSCPLCRTLVKTTTIVREDVDDFEDDLEDDLEDLIEEDAYRQLDYFLEKEIDFYFKYERRQNQL